MSEKTGQYIVIEGTDGAGTTTQKDLLKTTLLERGHSVIDVAEPGGTPIGDELRLIIKNGTLARDPQTNLDLFTVCRRELAQQILAPALEAGTHIVSDRNWFSTVAYQGFGEGLDVDEIVSKTAQAMGKLFLPTAAMVIDVPVEVSAKRMQHRGVDANDTFEQKGTQFFEKVREGYLWVAEQYGLHVIDGTQSIEAVHAEVLSVSKGIQS